MTAIRWDPVHSSRETFLTCMWAICSPGRATGPLPAPGLSGDAVVDGAAGVLASLLDPGLTLAVVGDDALRTVATAVCAATGASEHTVEQADFVLVGTVATTVADRARRGTARRPETGATLVYCGSLGRTPAVLDGPGLERPVRVELPVPHTEVRAILDANASAPAGVDVLVVTAGGIVALPRSTSIEIEGA